MRSFFIGAGIFLVLVPLAPLTALWVIGERFQGRHGIWLSYRNSPDPTPAGLVLFVSTILFTIAWPFIIAAALRSA